MNDERRKGIEKLSNEDLLNMIDRDADQHDLETLEAAREEAEARGGIDHLYSIIEEQLGNEEHLAETFDKEMVEETDHELIGGIFSNVRTLKDETIAEVDYFFVRGAAGHADSVIAAMQNNLKAADIPLQCRWGVTEVKTKGWISRVRRNFLIIDVDEFSDYHCYISVRDFGIYLDCIRILTIEPGFVKKFISKRLAGDEEALSAPKNILKHQDLHSWNEAVKDCFNIAVESLIGELEQTQADIRTGLRRGEKRLLDIW